MLRRSNRSGPFRSALTAAALYVAVASALACGGGDGPAPAAPGGSEAGASGVGRYKLHVLRTLGNPQIYRFDTSTGELTASSVHGAEAFAPMASETPPGLDDPIQPGRFAFEIAPGRGGPSLLRTDTVSGRVWLFRAKTDTNWSELDTGRDSGDAAGRRDRAAASESRPPAADPPASEASQPEVVLPQNQPPPTPQLAALQHMLDSQKTTPELRAWAVGQLATHYPEEKQRLLDALQHSSSLVVVAAIEAVDLRSDERYESTIEGLQGSPDPAIAAAARKKLSSAD